MTQVTWHTIYTIRHDLHNLLVVKNETVIVDNLVGNMRYLYRGGDPAHISDSEEGNVSMADQIGPALLVVSAHVRFTTQVAEVLS